jgi:predicted  nucleic acid-binding Zn-ribbon protein
VPSRPVPASPTAPAKDVVDAKIHAELKQEFDAMRAAFSVRIEKIQKERDEIKEKNKELQEQIKNKSFDSEQSLKREFERDIDNKTKQIEALNVQIEHEQKRYVELKQQLVMQAEKYQQEREELVEKLKHEIDSDKIEGLKDAFRKELDARVEAEISRVNEALAMREVELFYRDEQLHLFQSEIKQLKVDRQDILKESGKHILQALENNGVTLVAYNVGVGHITLPLDDVGQYLDERLQYLADRCGVSPDVFAVWQEHYYKPVCHFVDGKGDVCNKAIKRTDLASEFVKGRSDRCVDHQHIAP